MNLQAKYSNKKRQTPESGKQLKLSPQLTSDGSGRARLLAVGYLFFYYVMTVASTLIVAKFVHIAVSRPMDWVKAIPLALVFNGIIYASLMNLAFFLTTTAITTLIILIQPLLPGVLGQWSLALREAFWPGIYDSIRWSIKAFRGSLECPSSYTTLVLFLASFLAVLYIWRKPSPGLYAYLIAPLLLAPPQASEGTFPLVVAFLFLWALTFSNREIATRNEKKDRFRIPLVLISLLLISAFLVQSTLPEYFFRNKKLADWFEEQKLLRDRADTINYYEFTLRETGFYPQSEHLGGPVKPSRESYMKVTGPAYPLYLRASVFNKYEGNTWRVSEMEPNYLFLQEKGGRQQEKTFGYPNDREVERNLLDRAARLAQLTVYPVKEPIQVIFSGGRVLTIRGQADTQYYYNNSGQIYSSKVIGKDGYLVQGYFFPSLLLERELPLMAAAEQIDLKVNTTTVRNYETILRQLHPRLADIVYSKAENAVARYNQLLGIQRYLATEMKYRLDVPVPPPNQDFLQHFLQTKEGYCTYFATAFTLLLREAGYEARYVEGFVAPGISTEDALSLPPYTRDLNYGQAHAWTEVNIENLGWIPFDATPGPALSGISGDSSRPENQVPTTPPPTVTQTQTQHIPQQSTSPPSSGNHESKPSSPLQTEAQGNIPSVASKLSRFILPLLLLLVLVLIPLLWILKRRKIWILRHNKEYLLQRSQENCAKLCVDIWSDLKAMDQLLPAYSESPQTVLQRFKTLQRRMKITDSRMTMRAFVAVEQVLYGEIQPSQENVLALIDFYESAEVSLKMQMPRLHWFVKRWLFSAKLSL